MELEAGATVGRFVIVRRLGAGGMGTVYEARDPELARSVAIKLVREPDRHLALRLLREAQALAQLQHPNVVAVHELGIHDDEVFVAMELVDGDSLDHYLERERPDWRGIVALFADAARGLAEAHGKGLVHRDVKPGNLLVDATGRVRVGDFGLARLSGGDDGRPAGSRTTGGETVDDAAATVDGVDGSATTVDAATTGTVDGDAPPLTRPAAVDDRASTLDGDAPAPGLLGSPLTRVGALVGTPRYMAPEQLRGRRVTAASDQFSFCVAMWEALFDDHPFESDDVATNRRRHAPPRRAPRWLVRALDRGMALDPAGRHASMAELGRVLERGLAGRRRTIVAVAAIAIAVVGGLGAWRLVAESRRADREADTARAASDAELISRASALVASDPTAAVALLGGLSEGSPAWRAARGIAGDAAARGIAHVLDAYGRAELLAASADGRLVAAWGDGRLRLWNLDANSLQWSVPTGGEIFAIGFAPDAVIAVEHTGAITRHALATGAPRDVARIAGRFHAAAVAPGGRRVALIGTVGPTRIVDTDTGASRSLPVYRLAAWAPDGASLVLYDRVARTVVRADAATAERGVIGSTEGIRGLTVESIATDGTRIWLGAGDGRVVELVADAIHFLPTDHHRPITALVPVGGGAVATAGSGDRTIASPTDKRAAAVRSGIASPPPEAVRSGIDTTIAIVSADEPTVQLRGHTREIDAIAIAGTRVVSSDTGGSIRIWRRTTGATTPGDGGSAATAALVDGNRVVIARRGPVLEVRDLATHAVRRIDVELDRPPPWSVRRVTAFADRKLLEVYTGYDDSVTRLVRAGVLAATLDTEHRAIAWDVDGGRARLIGEHATQLAICPDGATVAIGFEDRALRSWSAAGTQELGTLTATALACSRDRIVAAGVVDGSVALFDAANPRVLEGPGDRLDVLAFSHDGTTLVGGGARRELAVWDIATGARRAFRGPTAGIRAIEWSPDGAYVAAGAGDGSLWIWRLADGTGRELRGHAQAIRSIAFAANGEAMVTTAVDRSVRIWDLVANVGRTVMGPDLAAGFDGAGDVVGVDTAGAIARFADGLPRDEADLRRWIGARASERAGGSIDGE